MYLKDTEHVKRKEKATAFFFLLFFPIFLYVSFSFWFGLLWFFFSFFSLGALILHRYQKAAGLIITIRYVALPFKLGVSLQR